jgi:hypothetical protein
MRSARRFGAALAFVPFLLPHMARADEIDRCLAAHPEAQRLRLEGKLRAARTDLLLCARELCPGVVRAECGRWLGEVDGLLPSIVVSARTAGGADVSDARVLVDGEALLDHLDGRPLALDPGSHQIRVESPGFLPFEETAVLSEGDKARSLVLTLSPAHPTAAAGTAPEGAAPSSSGTTRPVPVTVYVAGGIALAGLASFGTFGLLGRSEYFNLKSTCSPGCSSAQDSPVRTKLIAADVSLGVSIAALVGGAIFYLTRPSPGPIEPAHGIGWHFNVTGRGAAAGADWVF